MKKLSTNELVVSAFINQNLLEASNPKKTLWFKRTKLYSYNSMLAIIDTQNKVMFIDYDISRYSITTAKQTCNLKKRIPNNYRVFSHPLEKAPYVILQWYWDEIDKIILKYNKAHKTKDTNKQFIKRLLAEAQDYIQYELNDTGTLTPDSPTVKYKHTITQKLFKYQIL